MDIDVTTLLSNGPVIVTFYRGGWCPFCNLELKAFQAVLPRIATAGASLVAISPEKPDDTVSTAEKNALSFPVLSDIGQQVGRAFGVVYAFTDEVRTVYDGFKLDIPAKNGTPDDWSLPLSATYVIGTGRDHSVCRHPSRLPRAHRSAGRPASAGASSRGGVSSSGGADRLPPTRTPLNVTAATILRGGGRFGAEASQLAGSRATARNKAARLNRRIRSSRDRGHRRPRKRAF